MMKIRSISLLFLLASSLVVNAAATKQQPPEVDDPAHPANKDASKVAEPETTTKVKNLRAAEPFRRNRFYPRRTAVFDRLDGLVGDRIGDGDRDGIVGRGRLFDGHFLGGRDGSPRGRVESLLDLIRAEADFPDNINDSDDGMIFELLQDIMSMLQGGGLLNPENNIRTILTEWIDNLQDTRGDQGCAQQDQSALPECAWNLRGEPGVWVCRSLYNPETGRRQSYHACAHPEFTFPTIDVCGACTASDDNSNIEEVSNTVPELVECKCPCTTNRNEVGVGMNVFGVMERCYPASIVNTAVNSGIPGVECAQCN